MERSSVEQKEQIRWIVLCNTRKVQIYEQHGAHPTPCAMFDAPINKDQLRHEMEWHFRRQPHGETLPELLQELIVHAYSEGEFNYITLVAPPQVSSQIKFKLPQSIHSVIRQTVEKDLTHCPPSAISSYFANRHH